MSYNIETIPFFDKQVKRLSKKYPSFKSDLKDLIISLSENPIQGDLITENIYKIRLAITSKGKGKSKGARVITFVKIEETTVYLTSIYDKSDQSSISKAELIEIINMFK